MIPVPELRFCAYQYQHLPFPELRERWRRAEDLGFDVMWNVDTVVEPDRARHPIFDGPATLVDLASTTSRIRVGTLISSLYFRSPVTLAKATMTVDHLSGGRVELALGVGDPSAGAAQAGVAWSPAERVRRFREFVELTDLLLRQETTTYDGEYYSCQNAETIPLPVQRPRPPITVAAHGPKMLGITAEFADSWSSWGGYGIETEEQFFRATKERAELLAELCAARGRDPRSLRHSLVCFPPLTPWASTTAFREMVERYGSIGIDEFVLYWPRNWDPDATHEDAVFEDVMTSVVPELRARGRS
jgi:alkanesulfonate monooxygenase SsuD/methylene tetrahydromethanopterin reductase-like flavin-dependent oxidoreductase (luciferase family)